MSAIASAPTNGGAPDPGPLPSLAGGLFDELLHKIPEIQAELTRLDEQQQALMEAYHANLGTISEQRKRLNALLRALGIEPPAKRQVQKNNSKKGRGVGTRILLQMINGITAKDDKEYFTALGLHHDDLKADWSEPHTYQGIILLRKMEVIGEVRKTNGRSGRMLYRVLDRAAAERLRVELEAALGNRSETR